MDGDMWGRCLQGSQIGQPALRIAGGTRVLRDEGRDVADAVDDVASDPRYAATDLWLDGGGHYRCHTLISLSCIQGHGSLLLNATICSKKSHEKTPLRDVNVF